MPPAVVRFGVFSPVAWLIGGLPRSGNRSATRLPARARTCPALLLVGIAARPWYRKEDVWLEESP
jgi:hypothetical protein